MSIIARRRIICKGLAKFVLVQPQHADAVFELRVILVIPRVRDLPPRGQVKFVGRVGAPRAPSPQAFRAAGVDRVEHRGGCGGVERLEFRQARAIAGHPAGNRGHAL